MVLRDQNFLHHLLENEKGPFGHLVTYPLLKCSKGELYQLGIGLRPSMCMLTNELEFYLEDVQYAVRDKILAF